MREITRHPTVQVTATLVGGCLDRVTLSLGSAFILDCVEGFVQEALAAWLMNYAQGRWELFSLSTEYSPFFQKVASCLQATRLGTVVTYGELAALAGSPKAARAVGNFCQGNRFPLLIPCHRVVPSTHQLGRFTPDPEIKSRLLAFEGVGK